VGEHSEESDPRPRGRTHVFNAARRLPLVDRFGQRAKKRPGSSPGTIVHTGEKRVEQVRISFIDYDQAELRERHMGRIEECFPLRDLPTVTWINVDGLHDVSLIGNLGRHFGLHPLVLEDIAAVNQRPKLEEYEGYEQLSLVLGTNFVLTFQERIGDVFGPVRERLRSTKGRIRSRGPDYLAYALIDAVVDSYYAVLETVGDRVEQLDQAVMEDPTETTLQRIHELKREMLFMRRAVWPVRDVTGQLYRSEHVLVHGETRIFLRDVYDHSVQVLDTVETLRDMTAGLTDLHLSSVGQRQNEVMKVLTIMASIFIPLTFLAGIYGMNFRYMPELEVRWAYPALVALMAGAAGAMAWYFKRRGWW
jgi:magnesium transporter